MGVKDLWGILAPVKQSIPLDELRGQTLAVDLSIWVVETQGVQQMKGVVVKPYLRNLFFRIKSLLALGINLVFVIEGEPPQLKWDTMSQRTQSRFQGSVRGWGRGRGRGGGAATAHRPKRTHFKAIMRDCCQMLDTLGVPYVQAPGEAEATCAFLNNRGVVDACITNDGDAFLYGARRVYRNFSIDSKGKREPIESYLMSDIESQLHLYRQSLVGLALILGCDYLPKGIPGVGKESALKFFAYLGQEDILERFDSWTKNQSEFAVLEKAANQKKLTHCPRCKHPGTQRQHDREGCRLCHRSFSCEQELPDYECPCEWHQEQKHLAEKCIEYNIQKKAIKAEGFPWPAVVKEFLTDKDVVPKKALVWKRPEFLPFILMCERLMEWERSYSREKILPLLTLWDMKCILNVYPNTNSAVLMTPRSIFKARVKNGIACFEVHWNKIDCDNEYESEYYTTLEESEIFSKCFPPMVEDFELEKAAKPAKKKGKTSKKAAKTEEKENADLNELSSNVANLSLSSQRIGDERSKSGILTPSQQNRSNYPEKHETSRTKENSSLNDLSHSNKSPGKSISSFDLLNNDKYEDSSSSEELETQREVVSDYEESSDEDDFAYMAQAIEGRMCISSDSSYSEEDSVDEWCSALELKENNVSGDKETLKPTKCDGVPSESDDLQEDDASSDDENRPLLSLSERLNLDKKLPPKPNLNVKLKSVQKTRVDISNRSALSKFSHLSVVIKNSQEKPLAQSELKEASKQTLPSGVKTFKEDDTWKGASACNILDGLPVKLMEATGREKSSDANESESTRFAQESLQENCHEERDVEDGPAIVSKGNISPGDSQKKAYPLDVFRSEHSARTEREIFPPSTAPPRLTNIEPVISRKKCKKSHSGKLRPVKSQVAPSKTPWYRQQVDFSSDEDELFFDVKAFTSSSKNKGQQLLNNIRDRFHNGKYMNKECGKDKSNTSPSESSTKQRDSKVAKNARHGRVDPCPSDEHIKKSLPLNASSKESNIVEKSKPFLEQPFNKASDQNDLFENGTIVIFDESDEEQDKIAKIHHEEIEDTILSSSVNMQTQRPDSRTLIIDNTEILENSETFLIPCHDDTNSTLVNRDSTAKIDTFLLSSAEANLPSNSYACGSTLLLNSIDRDLNVGNKRSFRKYETIMPDDETIVLSEHNSTRKLHGSDSTISFGDTLVINHSGTSQTFDQTQRFRGNVSETLIQSAAEDTDSYFERNLSDAETSAPGEIVFETTLKAVQGTPYMNAQGIYCNKNDTLSSSLNECDTLNIDETVISGNFASQRKEPQVMTKDPSSGIHSFTNLKRHNPILGSDTSPMMTFDETVITGNINKVPFSSGKMAKTKQVNRSGVHEHVRSITQSQHVTLSPLSESSNTDEFTVTLDGNKRLSGTLTQESNNLTSGVYQSNLMLLNSPEKKRLGALVGEPQNCIHGGLGSFVSYHIDNSACPTMPFIEIDTPDLGENIPKEQSSSRLEVDGRHPVTPKTSLAPSHKRNYRNAALKMNTPSPVCRKVSKGTDSRNNLTRKNSISPNNTQVGHFTIDSSLLNFSSDSMNGTSVIAASAVSKSPSESSNRNYMIGQNPSSFKEDSLDTSMDDSIKDLETGALSEIPPKHTSCINETAMDVGSPIPLAKRLMSRFTRSKASTGTVLSQISTSQRNSMTLSENKKRHLQEARKLLNESDSDESI